MKWKVITIVILLGISTGTIFFYYSLTSPKHNHITFLDVGQGSSTLIETKDGKNILIDTGNDSISVQSLTKALGFFNRNLDIVVATHYDLDHVGLLPVYIKNYKVTSFIDTGVSEIDQDQKPLFDEIHTQLKNKNIETKTVHAGDIIHISDDVLIKIFFPGKFLDINKLSSNSGSMVLQIHIADKKILITGDLPSKFEKVLVQRYGDQLQSDILVAGHHGSKTSSDEIFLQTVNPKYFVISAGKNNSYGHPNIEVLERAEKLNIEILRTDQIGNIDFTSIENTLQRN